MEVLRVGSVLGLVVALVVGVMTGSALSEDRPADGEPDVDGLVELVQAVLDGLTEVEERQGGLAKRMSDAGGGWVVGVARCRAKR